MKEKHLKQRARGAVRRQRAIPEVYMPAMPPLGLMEAIGRWIAARRRRRAMAEVSKLDDRLLQDLGLTRDRARDRGPEAVRLRVPEARSPRAHAGSALGPEAAARNDDGRTAAHPSGSCTTG